jgi:hypothetical protein
VLTEFVFEWLAFFGAICLENWSGGAMSMLDPKSWGLMFLVTERT